MALPQRRDPEEQRRREIEELERRRLEQEPIGAGWGGWWLAWWWIWLLIILAAFWFAGWGWGGYGGWWWGGRSRAVIVRPGNAQVSGPGVAVLNATDKAAFLGQPFDIRNVQVQKVVNNQAFWIGGNNNTTPMLVVLTGGGNSVANAQISQGNSVTVTGTVAKAPPSVQAKQNWQLNDDGAKRLQQEGAYVQATQVQKVH